MTGPDLSHGIEELAALIYFRVGAWHDFGYETPPAPHCKPIPPLGERSAEAIKAGHLAIKAIDELTRHLYALRQRLAGELRADEDVRAARVDAMLAAPRPQLVDDGAPVYPDAWYEAGPEEPDDPGAEDDEDVLLDDLEREAAAAGLDAPPARPARAGEGIGAAS